MIKNIIIIILLIIILGLFIAPSSTKSIIKSTGYSIVKISKDFTKNSIEKIKDETKEEINFSIKEILNQKI
jgi:hypothetical protein